MHAIVSLFAAMALPQDAYCDVAKVHGSDVVGGASFGRSMAVDGDVLAVGAPAHWHSTPLSGAVFVYRRQADGSWMELADLLAEDAAPLDQMGGSVGVSNGVVVAGAHQEEDARTNSGSVYVFEPSATGWKQTAKLAPSDVAAGDGFGYSVAISGNRVLAGAIGADAVASEAGAAYLFERDGSGSWIEVAKLAPAGLVSGANFGSAVALSGSIVLVGAQLDDGVGPDSGAVYVFEEGAAGFVATAELHMPVALPLGSAGFFGSSLALDGGLAIVGAPLNCCVTTGGTAYIFRRESSSMWSLDADLQPAGPWPVVNFGRRVALRGTIAAVGTPNTSAAGSSSGLVTLYESTSSGWVALGTLLGPDTAEGDSLGSSVALHAQGVLAGAQADDDQGSNAGSCYSFLLPADLPLVGCPQSLSLSQGGVHELVLDAGTAHAGKLYFALGTTSGIAPGFVYDGLAIPLNVDGYFLFALGNPSDPPLIGSLGVLSAAGTASIDFALPAGTDPALTGLVVHHAAVVWPLFSYGPLHFVSNAAPLHLKP